VYPASPSAAPTIDYVIPCGRPDSAAAAAALRAVEACCGGTSSRIVVVGAGLAGLRSQCAGDRFVWLETDRLLWPAENRNLGARACTADIIAFVDDDCVIEPGFAGLAARRFAEDSGLGGLTGRARSVPDGYWNRVYDLLLFGPVAGDAAAVDTVHFACVMCIRRAALETVGGFDASLRTGEDCDLAERLILGGWRTLYAPELRVAHHHGRGRWPVLWRYLYRGGQDFLALERKQARTGMQAHGRRRLKLALRPLHPLLAPLFAGRAVLGILRRNRHRRWYVLGHLPGLVAALGAFEAGRAVAWWRPRPGRP